MSGPLYREHRPCSVGRLWRLNAGDSVAWAGLPLDDRYPLMAAASTVSVGHPWSHDATSQDDLSRFSGSTCLGVGQPVENLYGTAGGAARAADGVLLIHRRHLAHHQPQPGRWPAASTR